MSRPWQFSEDEARSPFDPKPTGNLQPPSFKTNVNRNKSTKWTEAKNYSYDGDDWGGYDLYDEYGSYDDSQQSAADTGPVHSFSPASVPSTTLPSATSFKHRRNSFETGDEQRSFSAGQIQSGTPLRTERTPSQPLPSTSARAQQDATPTAPRGPYDIRRDFTQPAHVPPPLSIRASAVLSVAPGPTPSDSPSPVQFPPRRGSVSSSIPPSDADASPSSRPSRKPAPPIDKAQSAGFIRPADIYKRMEEERDKERRSLDSSRQSIESTRGRQASTGDVVKNDHVLPGFSVDSPALADAIGAHLASGPQAESDSGGLSFGTGAPDAAVVSTLPPVSRVASAFGDEFWTASELSERLRLVDNPDVPASLTLGSKKELIPSQQPATSTKTLEHQPSLGFRSVVHQAFDRQDDSSAPLTPLTRDNSQSHYDSDTAGISPIMSRVPSSATAESRARAAGASVPPITEESSQPASPDVPAPLAGGFSVPRKPSPAHSRNVSGESVPSFTPGYRRSLEPPSQESGSAKIPELEYTKRLSHPISAEAVGEDPLGDDAYNAASMSAAASAPVNIPRTDYSKRESDIAEEASSSPEKGTAVSQAAQVARAQFLQTHSPTLVSSPVLPKPLSRATSPAGRVRELAGQYDEIHALSRSNSGLSMQSKSSIQSWERSDENIPQNKSAVPVKSPVDELHLPEYNNATDTSGPDFRPHLPGEWVSYVSTAEPGIGDDDASHEAEEALATDQEQSTPGPLSRSLEPIDLTPSTAKQTLPSKDVSASGGSPIDAVKAAGDALGSALMASMGIGGGHEAKDFAEPQRAVEAPSTAPEAQRPSVGDVLLRPLVVDRAASSVATSVAPTPPLKDTPKPVEASTSSYFPQPVSRVDSIPFSTESSPQDLESDRLRKEIERSLDENILSTSDSREQVQRDQDAFDAPANLRSLQTGSATDEAANLFDVAPAPTSQDVQPEPDLAGNKKGRPVLDSRFSWERSDKSEPLFAAEDTEPRAPYERPKSSAALHIVNTNISVDSDSTVAEPPSEQAMILPALSATTLDRENHAAGASNDETGRPGSIVATATPDSDNATPTAVSANPPAVEAARIPPFREILALKSAPERIDKYNETRSQFASMDSGLSNWITATLSSRPEYSHLAADPKDLGLVNSNAVNASRHKSSPGIMKITRKRGNSSAEASTAAVAGPERQSSVSQSGAERMQAKGKDFMKSAGAFGGKATFGAKGLFAKAKGKLREGGGGEKATTTTDRPRSGLKAPETVERPSSREASEVSTTATKNVDFRTGHTTVPLADTERDPAIARNSSQRAPASTKQQDSLPTKTNKRFSAALTRLRSRSQSHARSRSGPANAIPISGTGSKGSSVQTPTMTSPGTLDVAPWSSMNIEGIAGINSPVGQGRRIGVLPSPAAEIAIPPFSDVQNNTQVPEAGSQEQHSLTVNEITQEQDHSGTIAQKTEGNEDGDDDDLYIATPSAARKSTVDDAFVAINKTMNAVETSEARPSAESRRTSSYRNSTLEASQSLLSSVTVDGNEVRSRPNVRLSLASPVGSIVRSPGGKPSRFSDVPPLDMTMLASDRAVSPVSSLGPASSQEATATHVARVVSPIHNPASVSATESTTPSVLPGTSGARQSALSEAIQQEQKGASGQDKPELPRTISRSNLPSQQRPPIDARRTSWGPRSMSRRSSQILESATEGVATPRFGSRRGSMVLGQGFEYGDWSEEEQAEHGRQLAKLMTEHQAGRTAGPYAEHVVTESTLANPASSTVQIPRQSSATILRAADHVRSQQSSQGYGQNYEPRREQYSYDSRPVSANARPQQEPVQQSYPHAMPQVTANIPPKPSQENLYNQYFGPPVQQQIQQPQGVENSSYGPSEQVSTRGAPRNIGVSPQAAINTYVAPDYTHSPAVPEDDPQQSEQGKTYKRRSGFMSSFSRSSSISSNGWQSRLPSRGHTSAGLPVDQQQGTEQQTLQHTNSAMSAAHQGRENAVKGNTLKKLQRSSTSSGSKEREKKEKRFSRLGSIFGRRNSRAGLPNDKPAEPPKRGNRLVKPMPRSATTPLSTPRNGSLNDLSGYDSPQQYNAQNNIPPPSAPPREVQALYQHQRGQRGESADDLPSLPAAWTAQAPGGWYTPGGRSSGLVVEQYDREQQQQPTLPTIQPTYPSMQQTTRRLHSEGFRHDQRYMTSSPAAIMPLQERQYGNDRLQRLPSGTALPDRVADNWEQVVLPIVTDQQHALQGSSSAVSPGRPIPRERMQQRSTSSGYLNTGRGVAPRPQRPLSGNWQRQQSYSSDAGGSSSYGNTAFEGFSSYGTSPSQQQQYGHRRHSSVGSERGIPLNNLVGGGGGSGLTPTNSRPPSFYGAAPKETYRMSSPFEGEAMLQMDYDYRMFMEQQQQQQQQQPQQGASAENGNKATGYADIGSSGTSYRRRSITPGSFYRDQRPVSGTWGGGTGTGNSSAASSPTLAKAVPIFSYPSSHHLQQQAQQQSATGTPLGTSPVGSIGEQMFTSKGTVPSTTTVGTSTSPGPAMADPPGQGQRYVQQLQQQQQQQTAALQQSYHMQASERRRMERRGSTGTSIGYGNSNGNGNGNGGRGGLIGRRFYLPPQEQGEGDDEGDRSYSKLPQYQRMNGIGTGNGFVGQEW